MRKVKDTGILNKELLLVYVVFETTGKVSQDVFLLSEIQLLHFSLHFIFSLPVEKNALKR